MNNRKALTPKMREYISSNPFYRECVHENVMALDIEMEHALYYKGAKIQELCAVVPVRQRYNRNPIAEHKAFSQWVALWRLALADSEYRRRIMEKYPKFDFYKELFQIGDRYGWDLKDFPQLQYRLYMYRLEATAP